MRRASSLSALVYPRALGLLRHLLSTTSAEGRPQAPRRSATAEMSCEIPPTTDRKAVDQDHGITMKTARGVGLTVTHI
jgi:hypothetical protein